MNSTFACSKSIRINSNTPAKVKRQKTEKEIAGRKAGKGKPESEREADAYLELDSKANSMAAERRRKRRCEQLEKCRTALRGEEEIVIVKELTKATQRLRRL